MSRAEESGIPPDEEPLLAKLRTANDKYRRAMQVERKLKRHAAETERSLARAERELEVRREFEQVLIREVLSAQSALARLRASRPMRTARILRNASRDPRALLSLPVQLVRTIAPRDDAHDVERATSQVRRRLQPYQDRLEALEMRADDNSVPEPALAPVGPRRSAIEALRRGSKLRVAMIVDDFTRMSIEPECEATHLTPDRWREELEASRPHLLFVESAWRGLDDSWKNTVGHLPKELIGILEWCREHRTPTVFWNKEDPVHFSTFLNVASRFDHIFTTDIDSIPAYKHAVGHDRVWLMPFACQPLVHNPLFTGARSDGIMFAGAYYRRYPERNRDLESLVDELAPEHEIDIFDRNFGSDVDEYRFPDSYAPLIRGMLAPGEVPQAYKKYRYGLNLNSVKQSPTMFARRVYELMASGTLVLGNYSRGVRTMFGDLTISVDDGGTARETLARLDDMSVRKLRHAALRKVLSEHTYADRLAYLRSRVTGDEFAPFVPTIVVLLDTDDPAELERLRGEVSAQRSVRAHAIPAQGALAALRSAGEAVVAGEALDAIRRSDYVAVWRPDDYHGPELLQDLALAHRYANTAVVGIDGGFELVRGEVIDRAGTPGQHVPIHRLRAALVKTAALGLRADVVDGRAVWEEAGTGLAIEPFGFCAGAGDGGVPVSDVVDAHTKDAGVPMRELYAAAESLEPLRPAGDGSTDGVEDVATAFGGFHRDAVRTMARGAVVQVDSKLSDGVHDYLFSRRRHHIADVVRKGQVELFVECTPGLNVQIAIIYYGEDEQRIGSSVHFANQNASSTPPPNARNLRLALRVAGEGFAEIRRIEFRHHPELPAYMPLRGDALLVTNVYPSREDRYRNGFVHSRVKAYQRAGLAVDVLAIGTGQHYRTYEHEAVDVAMGSPQVLERAMLARPGCVLLVHFLDASMWDAIQRQHQGRRVLVWLHGAEVQPWWRRSYNYQSEAELDAAKRASEARLEFWRQVFSQEEVDVHFVFVSEYFAEEVMEDVGVQLQRSRYSVVHNPVDTGLFRYEERDASARLKVLSIRPFASAKYANDLSVAAVRLLQSEPEFADMEFRFVGDGPLFDSTLEPVRGIPNVVVEKRFLSHDEIARLHRDYGVFLVPTRMDAQGVSRDEAMSSGLVPVTTRVAAVPEFVDENSGMLCEPESAESLAAALIRLVREPELYLRLSCGAAERVRVQVAQDRVLAAELALMDVSPARVSVP